MKRVMAGEYSLELGTRTLAGAMTGVRLGFKQGGVAVYGLRRMLVDADRQPIGLLQVGEYKGRAGDRVVYVGGSDEEVRIVRRIFRDYVRGLGPNAIVRQLKAGTSGMARNATSPDIACF